jgi:hypothetical protein
VIPGMFVSNAVIHLDILLAAKHKGPTQTSLRSKKDTAHVAGHADVARQGDPVAS